MRASLFTVALALIALPAFAADVHDTSAGKVSVERVVGDLSRPWAVDFLPGDGMLITERDTGVLWRVARNGNGRNEVAGVPEVSPEGQGGLLDLVVARDFADSREIFLSYAEPRPEGQATALAVARLSEDGERLENVRVIFRLDRASGRGQHFGGRIVEAPDGELFLTIGDRGRSDAAQDLQAHNGKVIRIGRDGSIPADNPFADGGGLPEIWSLGHRNPQGAALDAEGRLWTNEHGARGGDEINRPQKGLNYGWPRISYGTHYSGAKIGVGTHAQGLEQPVYYWDPSIAPSGMTIYSGRLWPEWEGDIFVGSLKFDFISRLERDGDEITGEERLFEGDYERIRDIAEGPDGALWFLTEGEGALYRMSPAE
ncbi:MAG: hypothetical protein TEF_05205 [Rhizobiales bacterium NRL2]|jgi:glucose/arabinose dehydrogenase|nr:MAG: hypothetical protein TEF_05205 [Rhizobiales bacterium NRL2]